MKSANRTISKIVGVFLTMSASLLGTASATEEQIDIAIWDFTDLAAFEDHRDDEAYRADLYRLAGEVNRRNDDLVVMVGLADAGTASEIFDVENYRLLSPLHPLGCVSLAVWYELDVEIGRMGVDPDEEAVAASTVRVDGSMPLADVAVIEDRNRCSRASEHAGPGNRSDEDANHWFRQHVSDDTPSLAIAPSRELLAATGIDGAGDVIILGCTRSEAVEAAVDVDPMPEDARSPECAPRASPHVLLDREAERRLRNGSPDVHVIDDLTAKAHHGVAVEIVTLAFETPSIDALGDPVPER